MSVEEEGIDELAIVAEPGGMQGARIAGALNGLKDKGIKSADYLVGPSSAAPALAYFESNDLWKGSPIWINEVADDSPWDFVGKMQRILKLTRRCNEGKSYFEVDKLVDELFAEKYPLNLEHLESSDSKFIVPITDAETGKVEYLSEDEIEGFYEEDVFFDILRATMAEPFTYGRPVDIDGNKYFDGAFASPLPVDAPMIDDAFKIVLRTKNSPPAQTEEKEKNIFRSIYQELRACCYHRIKEAITAGVEDGFRKAMDREYAKFRQQEKYLEKLKEDGEAIVVEADSYVSRVRDDKRTIERNMEEGRRDVRNNLDLERLVEYLEKSPKGDKYLE